MAEIEIDEQQRDYLDQLRDQLTDEHVGEYGHVRDRDALQYLIDHHEATADVESDAAAENVQGESAVDEADVEESDGTDDEENDEPDADDDETSGSASRLERMMGLLDDHDDVWEQSDSEEGRYAVTLPDGSTERVRTKDDVRALLFQHYD